MEGDKNLIVLRERNRYSIGEFAGKERFIKFDLNAFAEMENMYGTMDAANEALQSGKVKEVRRLLWLGLIHDEAILDDFTGEPINYSLKIHEVGSWLTPDNMQKIMDTLVEAINATLPENEEKTSNQTPTKVNQAAIQAVGQDPNK